MNVITFDGVTEFPNSVTTILLSLSPLSPSLFSVTLPSVSLVHSSASSGLVVLPSSLL